MFIKRRLYQCITFTAITVLTLLPSSLLANSENTGTTAMDFLRLGHSVESVALGNAMVAAPGLGAMTINPASLGSVRGTQLDFQLLEYIQDISYLNVYGSQATNYGVFGLNIGYIDFGSSLRTTLSDQSGSTGNRFSNNGYQVLANYALNWKGIDLGAGLRYASLTLDGQTSDSVGLDVGAQCSPISDWTLGASVTNITLKEQQFIVQSDELPQTIHLGAQYERTILYNPVTFYSTLSLPNDDDIYGGVGAQVTLNDRLHLRGGYTTFGDVFGTSLGIGLDMRPFIFDFTYRPSQDLGESYRFGIGVVFGDL